MMNSNNNMRSVADYNLGGVNRIWLIDIDSFGGCLFKDDGLSAQCLVENIAASGQLTELDAINESNYTETYSDGIYGQKLSTSIYPLQGETLSEIIRLSAKKHFVIFQCKHNRFFGFGNDGGAAIAFWQQTGRTDDIQGYNLTISKESTTPLFEIADINKFIIRYKYIPCFDDGVFCQLTNGLKNGLQIAPFALKTSFSGKAVDINGNLCSQSGLPQAIKLLEGFRNPDNKYQVEGTYSDQTTRLNNCPIVRYHHLCQPDKKASVKLSKSTIELKNDVYVEEIKVISWRPWQLISDEKDIAKCSISTGLPGESYVKFYKGTEYGLGRYIFRSGNAEALLLIYNYPVSESLTLSDTYIVFNKTADKEERKVQIRSSIPWKLDTKLPAAIHCRPSYGKAGTTEVTIAKEDVLQDIKLAFSTKRGTTCSLYVIVTDKEVPEWVLSSPQEITDLSEWNNSGYWINNDENKWNLLTHQI